MHSLQLPSWSPASALSFCRISLWKGQQHQSFSNHFTKMQKKKKKSLMNILSKVLMQCRFSNLIWRHPRMTRAPLPFPFAKAIITWQFYLGLRSNSLVICSRDLGCELPPFKQTLQKPNAVIGPGQPDRLKGKGGGRGWGGGRKEGRA